MSARHSFKFQGDALKCLYFFFCPNLMKNLKTSQTEFVTQGDD